MKTLSDRLPLVVTLGGVLMGWWLLTAFGGASPLLLPSPPAVVAALCEHRALLMHHSLLTMGEIVVGMLLAVLAAVGLVIGFVVVPRLAVYAMPLLTLSQALPVFVLAPVLMLWLGYGWWPKTLMAAITLFFPLVGCLWDAVQRLPGDWRLLRYTSGCSAWRWWWYVGAGALRPAFVAGWRIAAVYAPLGAVVGEWVGAGAGLGFVMQQANARLQTPLMFAALLCLLAMGLALYAVTCLLETRIHQQIIRERVA